MMRISKAAEIRPPVKKADGAYQFWVKNEQGTQELRPGYAPNLGPNADPKTGWTGEFIDNCQDETHMDVHRDFLITVPPHYFLSILASVTWQGLWDTWRKMEKGTYDESTSRNLMRGREYHRSNKVSVNYHCGQFNNLLL
jgi:hypothetical protein